MSINVYVSKICGSTAIKKKQAAITGYLDANKIEYEEVDLAVSNNKEIMRANIPAERKEGKGTIIAPQIFKGDEYLGDYDDFFCAQEDKCLHQFFKLPPPEEKESEGQKKIDVRSVETCADDKENNKNAENIANDETQDIEKKDPDGETSPIGVRSGNGGESAEVEKNEDMGKGESGEAEQKRESEETEQKGENGEAKQKGGIGEEEQIVESSEVKQDKGGESGEVEQDHEGESIDVEQGHEGESGEVEQDHERENGEVEQGHEGESDEAEQDQLHVVTEEV